MAILIYGKTRCCVCGVVIEGGSDIIGFPAFILNENDSLFRYSDTVCHRYCAESSPSARRMIQESNLYLSKTGPGSRHCCVCEAQITEYSEYFLIGYLGRDNPFGLHKFNYLQFHKAHIHSWVSAADFLKSAQAELASGRWKGPHLLDYVKIIKSSVIRSS